MCSCMTQTQVEFIFLFFLQNSSSRDMLHWSASPVSALVWLGSECLHCGYHWIFFNTTTENFWLKWAWATCSTLVEYSPIWTVTARNAASSYPTYIGGFTMQRWGEVTNQVNQFQKYLNKGQHWLGEGVQEIIISEGILWMKKIMKNYMV